MCKYTRLLCDIKTLALDFVPSTNDVKFAIVSLESANSFWYLVVLFGSFTTNLWTNLLLYFGCLTIIQ